MNEYVVELTDGFEVVIMAANSVAASMEFEDAYPDLVQEVVSIRRNDELGPEFDEDDSELDE